MTNRRETYIQVAAELLTLMKQPGLIPDEWEQTWDNDRHGGPCRYNGAHDAQPIPHAEAFLRNTGARIVRKTDGRRGAYNSEDDTIYLPTWEQMCASPDASATENNYLLVLHELAHWTGVPWRNNRKGFQELPSILDHLTGGFLGFLMHAYEEMVAELGTCFLARDLGVLDRVTLRSAQYVYGYWRNFGFEREIFLSACAEAKQACDSLHALQQRAAA